MFPGDDFTMYLWDPTNNGNKPVARLLGHQNKVNQVQFSPDGTLIASAGWDNHTVRPPIHRFIHLNRETDFNDTEIVERQRWQVPQELKGSRRAGKSPLNRKHSPLLTSNDRSTSAHGPPTADCSSQAARTAPSKCGTHGMEISQWTCPVTKTRYVPSPGIPVHLLSPLT